MQVELDKVEKRGNQWCVVHCHGEEAGEVIKCFDTEEEAQAMHRVIEASKHSGDQQRKIGFDIVTLDPKILLDDDKYLVMPAVIASEIVHQYDDGWAYKPADELEKTAKTAMDIGSLPLKILSHPTEETNYLLLKQSDVHGRAENFQFVKNLIDTKTGRPMRRGIKSDLRWFKDRVPCNIIEQIKNNTLHDVSIGFTFDTDKTPGEWEGTKYDYVQRNIFLNHVAAPIETGRCPGPICGIGFDKNQKYGLDEATLNSCPVCRSIADVGLLIASKRLGIQYGSEVVKVILGQPLIKLPESNIDKDFAEAFKKLKSQLQG